MRFLILCLALTLNGVASANDLVDANKALETKSYPQALQLFSKLASAGNAEAKLRLGEMYWYGEGVALDRAKGDALFASAAASGNQAAVVATGLSAKREQHKTEIAYWASGYDGADLVAGKFNCVAPTIPELSKTKNSISTIGASADSYTACYNGFIDNLASAMPPGKRVPENIAILMSEQELAQSAAHLGKVYASVAARAKAVADQVQLQRGAWLTATTAYITTQDARDKQNLLDMQLRYRQMNISSDTTRIPPPVSTSR